MSHDFLIVVDTTGNCLDIGSHLRKALALKGLQAKILEGHLRQSLLPLLQGQPVTLPLDQYGIASSPFSLLHQDSGRIVLIAEDQTRQHLRQPPPQHIEQKEPQHLSKEERIHILLDESSDPIFGFEEDGTYLYVNNVFARTLGYEKEEVIGKKIWDIFAPDEADRRFALVKKVFLTGTMDTIEVRVPLPTGGNKYFLTTVKPIKDRHNRVSFVICISKDITELREAQGQLQTLHGLLPICSSCKNVRNDKGAWQQIEDYISLHSEAVFTHGICPDCAKKLYPGMFDHL
jgi:PAS domain S-box-containing protein